MTMKETMKHRQAFPLLREPEGTTAITNFMFCTGIENSNPTIDHGRTRIDELESCHFYERWREDFALVKELGIHFLRYGPPIHRTFLGPGRHDWSFADETFAELRRLRIEVDEDQLA